MATWGDIADQLESRVRRMDNAPDIAELLLAAYNLQQQFIDQWDLDCFTVQNDTMFVTQPNQRVYALPRDFGRLMHSREEISAGVPGTGSSGIFLRADPTQDTPLPLQYRPPVLFRQQRTLTTGPPNYFTFGQEAGRRTLVLDPPPDDNGGTNYTGEGVYITKAERPDLEDEVLLDEPSILVAGVLTQLGGDATSAKEYERLLSAMVNNQARKRTQFYLQRWPVNRWATR